MIRNILVAGAFACHGLTASGSTVLSSGHMDIGLEYKTDSQEWDLHVHDEATDVEYEPEDVVLQVGAAAETTITANTDFLGTPGDPAWVLPATAIEADDLSVLFLGISTEEIDGGVFETGITLALRDFDGPGDFALYTFGSLGDVTVFMNTRGGAPDEVTIPVGTHMHAIWAFTAPGTYTLGFEAFGNLTGGEPSSSGIVDYTFHVVPEPGTIALTALGALGLLVFARRRR